MSTELELLTRGGASEARRALKYGAALFNRRGLYMTQNAGDLARCKTHEANDDWPWAIEIVAYWGDGRKGRRRSVEIPADQFFGRGGYGAPMSGEQLIHMVDVLRRQGPSK